MHAYNMYQYKRVVQEWRLPQNEILRQQKVIARHLRSLIVQLHIRLMLNDVTKEQAPNPQSNNSHHLMKTQIKSILVQTFSIINLIYQLTLFCLSFSCQFEWMYEQIYSDFNKKFSPTTNDTHFPCNFLPSMLFIFPMPNWFIVIYFVTNCYQFHSSSLSHSLVLCINVYYDIEMRKFIFDLRSFYCLSCW
jgi:hypothetical protein